MIDAGDRTRLARFRFGGRRQRRFDETPAHAVLDQSFVMLPGRQARMKGRTVACRVRCKWRGPRQSVLHKNKCRSNDLSTVSDDSFNYLCFMKTL